MSLPRFCCMQCGETFQASDDWEEDPFRVETNAAWGYQIDAIDPNKDLCLYCYSFMVKQDPVRFADEMQISQDALETAKRCLERYLSKRNKTFEQFLQDQERFVQRSFFQET